MCASIECLIVEGFVYTTVPVMQSPLFAIIPAQRRSRSRPRGEHMLTVRSGSFAIPRPSVHTTVERRIELPPPLRPPQVAFTSPANAAPYLYAVPPDLACFDTLLRRFGVRPSFGPSDFCHALRRLAVETGAAEPGTVPVQTSEGGGMVASLLAMAGSGRSGDNTAGGAGAGSRVARPLSPAQVDLAVAMVQVSKRRLGSAGFRSRPTVSVLRPAPGREPPKTVVQE